MKTNNKKELLEFIHADFYRCTGQWKGLSYAIFNAFLHPFSSATFMLWFRLAQFYRGGLIGFYAKSRYKKISLVRNIDIPLSTNIGYGLYLGHFMCIVISPLANIGNNCNISQFVNIGSNDGPSATIGDNVYVGPHVSIIEDVSIGNNVTIGAGAVVTKDIPDNATAAGVPAKVLNYSNPGRYIGRRYHIKDNLSISDLT